MASSAMFRCAFLRHSVTRRLNKPSLSQMAFLVPTYTRCSPSIFSIKLSRAPSRITWSNGSEITYSKSLVTRKMSRKCLTTSIDGEQCLLYNLCFVSWSNWHRFSIRLAPEFTGLRRFKDGRRFKQWTGDDNKALMKVCT
jgi:hypothetical protein